jgi:hypothetical protein
MPSKDVGCDPAKIIPEDQYQEYVNDRPSLKRRNAQSNTKQQQIGVSGNQNAEEVK